jgi:hypothetical protein
MSGSVWPGPARLVEEVAIGSESQGPDYLLGQIMAIDSHGERIYLADRITTSVRVYDRAGAHVMDVGREGGGPGEFYLLTDLGIDPVRRHLVVREGTGVLHRFSLDGEYVGTVRPRTIGSLSGAGLLLRVTRSGKPMIRHLTLRPSPEHEGALEQAQGFFAIDSTGAATDTLWVPRRMDNEYFMRAEVNREAFRPQRVPFGPLDVFTISLDGEPIKGYSGEYRFQVWKPDGRVMVVEREVDPVPVPREERAAAERRTLQIMRDFQSNWVWNGPSIPHQKPFFEGFFPDRSGRLWVLREGAGRRVEGWEEPEGWRDWEGYPEWVSEYWFEVFDQETGRFLGQVDVPKGFQSEPEPFIAGEMFICLTADEVGRPVVRRYRLEIPAGES